MIYASAEDWRAAPHRRVLFYGMSGLGKTHLSNMLRDSGDWFHYSIDYRIGTRYMGELIADNAKAEAMKVPFLRDLLMSDSIYIGSNITFNNLSPVATYLGKPGDATKGGLPMSEYARRQEQFRQAEISALYDTAHFAARAEALYDYFVAHMRKEGLEVATGEFGAMMDVALVNDGPVTIWMEF